MSGRWRSALVAGLSCPATVLAQAMPGMDMSMHAHMHMPAPAPPSQPAPKPASRAKARPRPKRAPAEASPPAETAPPAPMPMPMPMPEHAPAATGHAMMPMPAGTDLPVAAAPAPPPAPPADHPADAVYGAAAMADARADLRREHGGMRFHQLFFNLAEAQVRSGGDSYRWDGEGWWGGDVDRLVLRSEGEGRFGERIDRAEAQALYSRAIGPYHDLQAGIRQDFGRGPKRTYATIGIEGLAPYWFETEARLFLSDRGDVLARGEAWYDQRITQRLVLQPRAELNFAAQDVSRQRIGRGLSDAELGLRLRYEMKREFAPYVGVAWERKAGRTARLARAAGEDVGGASAVIGIRAWF